MAPGKVSEHESSPPNTPTINPEKHIVEVYNWNLDHEFNNLLAAASGDASGSAILAIDMEFPGFLRQEPRSGARAQRYQALRENVDRLRLIQLGAAVADADGTVRGAWSFNLKFDIDVDLQSEKSMQFLRAAGLDFTRHKKEGIDPGILGRKLANSSLVGQRAPSWVTFAGAYDLAYLLKLPCSILQKYFACTADSFRMGDIIGLPCDEGEHSNAQLVQRLQSADGERLSQPGLKDSSASEAAVTVPFRISDGQSPKPHRDLLLPEQGLLDMIATLRAERRHPDVLGDMPVDDAESPNDGEIPGGKVLKATKLGPHLTREHPQAGLRLPGSLPQSPQGPAGGASEDKESPRPPRGGSALHLDPTRLQNARGMPPFAPRQLPQVGELGERPPDAEERRWIEAAVRRMFLLLSPANYEALMGAFREWKLPASTVLVKQGTPVSTGPSLCVLLDGVIDVLHCPTGAATSEKVCTYDRCGQCFGELELFYGKPGQGSGRKLHWATIETRTAATLWTVAPSSSGGGKR